MHCQSESRVTTMFAGPNQVDKTADNNAAQPEAGAAQPEAPVAIQSVPQSSSDTPVASSDTPVVVAKAAPAPQDSVQQNSATPGKGAVEQPESGAVLASNAPVLATDLGPRTNSVSTIPNYDDLAQRDPMAFLQFCWDEYKKNVTDYRCTFTKHERIMGQLQPEQIADVRFREAPFSVDMTFTKNIGECKRALYVADKWLDDEGNQQAWAKPGGAIVRLLISKILQPIHGPRAQKASRRTIDQFGFGKSFELIIHYSKKAQAEDALTLRYAGVGEVEGRPTYKFERILPYDGDEANYPDHLLVFHIDREMLLPVACYAYSDQAGNDLLGSYVYTDVVLNPGYVADDFDPDIINF